MYQEIKDLFNHSVVYGFGNLLSRAIGFIMIPIYTRFLTPEDYGVMALLVLFSSFVSLFFLYSVNNAFMRFYFEKYKKSKVYGTSLLILIVVSIFAIIILLPLAKPISIILFQTGKYAFFVQLTILTLALELVVSLPYSLFRARQESSKYIIFSTIKLIVALSLNIYFIVFLGWGILGFLYSMLITSIFMVILLLSITIIKIKTEFSYIILKKIIRFGAPLAPYGFLYFVYMNSDRFFLERVANLSEVGLYSLGNQFSNVLIMLILSPFLLNWGAAQFILYKKHEAKQLFPRILTYLATIMIFCGLGISIFIKDVLRIVAAKEFWGAANIVPLLVIAVIIWSLNSIFTSAVAIKKKTKYSLYVGIGAVTINLLFNFLLISKYGSYGAGFSKIITFGFILITYLIISQKLMPIKYEFKRLFLLVLVGSTLYFINIYIPHEPFLLSIFLRGILVLMFPIGLFLVRFFKKEEIRKLKNILKF